MMGGDLPTTSPETLALLKNPALAELLNTSYDGREVIREPLDDGELIVWTARGDDCSYAAIFWTGSTPREVSVPLESLAAQGSPQDLWDGPDGTCVPAHGVRWLKFS
jgi:alpha-galactosidase